MSKRLTGQSENKHKQENKIRAPYETPAIVYEGLITTRAGTPDSAKTTEDNGIDPADIFDN